MFQILKVTGESLLPLYREGDFVVVIKIPFLLKRIKPGDIVVCQHPVYGTLIKQVETISRQPPEISVIGLHANSMDSRQFGPLPWSAVTGKVICHVRKPGS